MSYAARFESPGGVDTKGCEWLAVVSRSLDDAPRVEQARNLAAKVLDHADPEQLLPRAEAQPDEEAPEEAEESEESPAA